MKNKNILLIITLLTSLSLFSQVRKKVENGIWVTFPKNPQYSMAQGARQYISQTDNAVCMVQSIDLPQRSQYLVAERNFSEAEKKEVADSFLNNYTQGVIASSGNTAQVSSIKKGTHYGRKISYSAINPITGEVTKRCSVVLFVRAKVVSIECITIDNREQAITEMNLFLNSITAKYSYLYSQKSYLTGSFSLFSTSSQFVFFFLKLLLQPCSTKRQLF